MNLSAAMAITLISVFLTGCIQYIARNLHMGEPARYPEDSWIKHGEARAEIRKALLECGMPSTQADQFVYEKALGLKNSDDVLNHVLSTHACMENSDYVYWRKSTFADYCLIYRDKQLPVCQPNAVIPQRNVETRLNSWLCKIKTDREYCRKHAFTPSACNDPKKDYDNPPPECRP